MRALAAGVRRRGIIQALFARAAPRGAAAPRPRDAGPSHASSSHARRRRVDGGRRLPRAPRRQRRRLERALVLARRGAQRRVVSLRHTSWLRGDASLAPPALAAAALLRAAAVAAAPRSFDDGLRLGALRRLLVEGFPLRRRFPRRVHDGRLEDLVRDERDDIFVLRGAGAPVLHFLIRARGPARCMQWLGSVCALRERLRRGAAVASRLMSMAGARAARKGSEIRRRCYCSCARASLACKKQKAGQGSSWLHTTGGRAMIFDTVAR